jgi:hypothetical protein
MDLRLHVITLGSDESWALVLKVLKFRFSLTN